MEFWLTEAAGAKKKPRPRETRVAEAKVIRFGRARAKRGKSAHSTCHVDADRRACDRSGKGGSENEIDEGPSQRQRPESD
jgi:hypothetical protein